MVARFAHELDDAEQPDVAHRTDRRMVAQQRLVMRAHQLAHLGGVLDQPVLLYTSIVAIAAAHASGWLL